MPEIINARGLACPQPVILAKKALEAHGEVLVLVDNTTAVENITRLASAMGCSVEVSDQPGGAYRIHLNKPSAAAVDKPEAERHSSGAVDYHSCTAGPVVFLITSDTMGRGSEELGAVLMKSFIHTATELEAGPDVMIFYNAGVKLVIEGSDLLDDLKKLDEKGARMLVCGTCADYFDVTDKIAVGAVSNMYDIAGILSGAGRIVQP